MQQERSPSAGRRSLLSPGMGAALRLGAQCAILKRMIADLALKKHGIVLPCGPDGAWDAGMVESPVVWFDSHRRQYGMVYTGYASTHPGRRGYAAVTRPQVGLAWSTDLLHWHKDPRSPIFGPSGLAGTPDAEGTPGPFIIQEGALYYLFYFGTTQQGYEKGTKTLNLATSSDLVHWARNPGNPIITPAGTGWRRDAIWHPHVMKHEGEYLLFLNASGIVDAVEEEYIGYARSRDLQHWQVCDDDSPLLVGSRIPGAWDARGRTGDPSVFRVGDRWYMAYYSWDGTHAQDGIAWTTRERFPLGWQPMENNPVLRLGPPGSCDALHAAKPFVIVEDGSYYHFYTAVAEDEMREIALATASISEDSFR